MSAIEAKVFRLVRPLDRKRTYALIQVLADRISKRCPQIDQIIATHDPDDNGGGYYVAAELFRLLSKKRRIRRPIDTISVVGRRGARRHVEGLPHLEPTVKRILLVGDASFSGNTRKIASDALREHFPLVAISTATITAGTEKPDFYALAVDERKVRFPWGQIDATGECPTPLRLRNAPDSVKFGYRVWGHYEEFSLNTPCTARMLTVLPDQRLSLQVHFRRDELFAVLDKKTSFECGYIYKGTRKLGLGELRKLVRRTKQGGKRVVLGAGHAYRGTQLRPQVGEYVLIPRGTLHRLIAKQSAVRVVEISYGFYDQNSDIARLHDDYGRENLSGRF